ncbi:shootin-1-like isoform X3 [Anastrepha ludens]|uniref:shootin-1-like isoform X3 n=1 Tax=Anastrepha ludens TaxID=28586 RepID=UPI0023B17222|nr:shootin-1-like isoform X3 [Anastrepha ludens]XP_053947182.1 shootin-1-like isoform X3 [Anastrepha ludens]
MERRGRIPVARFRTQEGKTRSRSRVRDPDYNEQDPETDLFTLLEDNIALKEENKALKVEIENGKKAQTELEEKETKVREELDALKKQHLVNETQIKELTVKFNKLGSERNALDKLHKMKIEKITSLENELQSLQENQKLLASATPPPSPPAILNVAVAPIASPSLSSKLLKIIPTLSSGEMESIVDVEPTAALPITSDLVERLVDEFQTLKNSMNAVELQLYEANEKIAELLENQHHLEEENETLRTENTNLTKVAKLLTENMKESVETSKKMEAALIKLKQRNDELNAKTRDITDGQPEPSPSPTTIQANEEFEQIKEEVESQNRDHNERIVEMKSLMEAAIQKNTNDELNTFKLKVEILEEELRKAIARAEHAEIELQKYKNNANTSTNCLTTSAQTEPLIITPTATAPTPPPPPPPPPLPPPLPTKLIYKQSDDVPGDAATFSDSIIEHNLQKESRSDKIIGTVKQQVQGAATGLDALVKEFKSGRVTLRRNRRKTRTNEALQEMFQVLEISQKQNRNSKICINMQF